MAKDMGDEPIGGINDHGPKASSKDLQAERTAALRRLRQAEEQRDEAQQLARIYAEAAEQLETKARQLRAEAESLARQGDAAAAENRLSQAVEAETLARQNIQLAEEKSRLARTCEDKVANERALAAALAAKIKRQEESKWDDWEL